VSGRSLLPSSAQLNLAPLAAVGHLKFLQRKPSEAIENYELVLKRNPRYTDVDVFMRLATLYVACCARR
jgi:hypothetical protein